MTQTCILKCIKETVKYKKIFCSGNLCLDIRVIKNSRSADGKNVNTILHFFKNLYYLEYFNVEINTYSCI